MLCQYESASRPDASAHLALINAGPEPEDFFGSFASELVKPLRKLTPSS
jgi:hypothetical protein